MIETGTLKLSNVGVIPVESGYVEYMKITESSIYDVVDWIEFEGNHDYTWSLIKCSVSIPSCKVFVIPGDYLVMVNGRFIGMTEDEFNARVEID